MRFPEACLLLTVLVSLSHHAISHSSFNGSTKFEERILPPETSKNLQKNGVYSVEEHEKEINVSIHQKNFGQKECKDGAGTSNNIIVENDIKDDIVRVNNLIKGLIPSDGISETHLEISAIENRKKTVFHPQEFGIHGESGNISSSQGNSQKDPEDGKIVVVKDQGFPQLSQGNIVGDPQVPFIPQKSGTEIPPGTQNGIVLVQQDDEKKPEVPSVPQKEIKEVDNAPDQHSEGSESPKPQNPKEDEEEIPLGIPNETEPERPLFPSSELDEYRLSNLVRPTFYSLTFFIPPLFSGNSTFYGIARIFLHVLQPTYNLTFHSSNLIINLPLSQLYSDERNFHEGSRAIPKNSYTYIEEFELSILYFSEELQMGDYTLLLYYEGSFDDDFNGIFRNSYVDNGERKYLIATNFGPTYARRAFPCWDEPGFKAPFDITIHHSKDDSALSNMPVKYLFYRDQEGVIETHFETTSPMSTYSVAFAVSNFKEIYNPWSRFSIWADGQDFDYFQQRNMSLYAFRSVGQLLPKDILKTDIIVIPEFDGYVTVNHWGLILLGSQQYRSMVGSFPGSLATEHMLMIKVASSSVACQWFGNFISPEWWDDYWIIQGLAVYRLYLEANQVVDDPKMLEFMVVDNNFISFEIHDQHVPPKNIRESPNRVQSLQAVSHNKFGALMYMMRGLMTENIFDFAVMRIMETFKYSTITAAQFWKIMDEAIQRSPNNIGFETVMKPYITQYGFPVIRMTRNYTTGTIKLTQECDAPYTSSRCSSKWWIPINYATKSFPDFTGTYARRMMHPNQEEFIINDVPLDDWVIFNIQSTAYYRVIYDEENLRRIAEYLNSDLYSNIHVLNRAAILEDALWLYADGDLELSSLMNLMSYLSREESYVPWAPGFKIMNHWVANRSHRSPELKNFCWRLIDSIRQGNDLKNRAYNSSLFTMLKVEKAKALEWRLTQRIQPLVMID